MIKVTGEGRRANGPGSHRIAVLEALDLDDRRVRVAACRVEARVLGLGGVHHGQHLPAISAEGHAHRSPHLPMRCP